MSVKIITGLGNPGPQYETTRHNVGFLAIDRLVEKWNAAGPSVKNKGDVYQATYKGDTVYLIKPRTFMNLSGQCVGPLYHFYHCKPQDLVVIHDDLDLKPITLKLKTGGGTGGHNGLKSIDEHLGKDQIGYHRVRIGIGHPSLFETPSKISPADYVLQQFSDAELKALDPFLDDVAEAVEEILEGKIQTAMNRFHRKEN